MPTTFFLKHAPWYVLLLLICLFFYLINNILTPFIISAVLAYLGSPLVDWLEKKGLSRAHSVFLVYFVILVFITITVIFLIPNISDQINSLYSLQPKIANFFQYDIWTEINKLLPFDKQVDAETVKETIKENVKIPEAAGSKLAEGLFGSASWAFSFLTNLGLIPIVTYYFLKNYNVIIEKICKLIPLDQRPKVVEISKESDENLSSFLRGQFIVMNILAIGYSIGLTAIGLQYSILIGFIAGYLNFVPFIGLWVGASIALITAAIQFSDTFHPLMVVGIFTVAQVIEGNFLTPQLVGDKIGLNPVTVIFAIMAGGELLGITGVLIALPISAVLKVILKHIQESYEESDFYEGEPTVILSEPIIREPIDSDEARVYDKSESDQSD